MTNAKEYYQATKHKDDWGVDVVYPHSVDNIIELAEYEGVLLGLKICKEMWAQGQMSHDHIRENEIYYGELLRNKLSDLSKETA